MLTLAVAMLLLAGAAHAGPVKWDVTSGGNGHWYEAVNAGSGGITWQASEAAAVARGGHLASITSAAENTFVFGLINGSDWTNYWHDKETSEWLMGPWIGGYQDLTADDYSEPGGGWRWSNGDAWAHTNWGPDDSHWWLNNVGGYENYAHYMGWSSRSGSEQRTAMWNDLTSLVEPVVSEPHAYIVEWNSDPGSPSGATPELSTWALLACSGLAGFVLRRRRKAAG